MKSALAALLLALMLPLAAQAVEPNERLADPVLEQRARTLSQGLRCLVCQNESIDESGADLAHDVRVKLRERIAAGDTDAQAVAYIVSRYGNFVLLEPPVAPLTYALWFGPPALLVVAGLALVIGRRRGAAAADPQAPLNPAERQALARLLQDSES